MLKAATKVIGCLSIALVSGSAFGQSSFEVITRGTTLTWGEDTYGYMQVQAYVAFDTLEPVCEFEVKTLQDTPSGNRDETTCELNYGYIYNVTNLTTGIRILDVVPRNDSYIYTLPEPQVVDGVVVRNDPVVDYRGRDYRVRTGNVPAAANLTYEIYSANAVEIFWDRADVPNLIYDVYDGDDVAGSTDGTSFFFGNLIPNASKRFQVVARDTSGDRSPKTEPLRVRMPDDGSFVPSEGGPFPPSLRAAVYSTNPVAVELFWSRQDPGQVFEVADSGNLFTGSTDGTSIYVSDLPPAESYTFSIISIDLQGNRSEPSLITVTTNGQPER